MRAVELVEPGASRDVVARILGIHPGSISRWRRRARHEGGLQARPIPGRPPRLSDAQITELEQLLLKGAVAHGWLNDLWTGARVATLIQRHFGVRLHPGHVGRMRGDRLNWSSQRPQRQHPDGSDDAVARWVLSAIFPPSAPLPAWNPLKKDKW
jgi:transposase